MGGKAVFNRFGGEGSGLAAVVRLLGLQAALAAGVHYDEQLCRGSETQHRAAQCRPFAALPHLPSTAFPHLPTPADTHSTVLFMDQQFAVSMGLPLLPTADACRQVRASGPAGSACGRRPAGWQPARDATLTSPPLRVHPAAVSTTLFCTFFTLLRWNSIAERGSRQMCCATACTTLRCPAALHPFPQVLEQASTKAPHIM